MSRRGNGEGTITRRRDGRWEARFTDGRGRSCLYGKTRAEVAAKLREAQRARDAGRVAAADRQTVAAYSMQWLETVAPNVDRDTRDRYAELLRIHVLPDLGHVELAKLTPEDLEQLYARRLAAGAAPMSVRHVHSVLYAMLGRAERRGSVHRNVAALVKPPKAVRRDMRTFDEAEYARLLNAVAGDRLESLYVVAVTTGMRLGELAGLRWRDLDLEKAMLQVQQTVSWHKVGWSFDEPKTRKSRRRIELARVTVESLRKHRARQLEERLRVGAAWQDHDLVFSNEVGGPLDGSNLLQRSFYPLLKRAQLPRIRFHDLRHTAATILLGRGVHPKIVSEMLGHSSVAITLDVYSHVIPTMQREAATAFDAIISHS